MNILWLNAGSAAAARQGGQAANVAPDAAPRSPARRRPISRSSIRRRRRPISRGCARSRPTWSRSRARILRKARSASTPTPPATSSIVFPTRLPSIDRPTIGPPSIVSFGNASLMPWSAIFLPPVVNLPESLPCPAILFTHNVEADIWRRHAENATNPITRFLLRQQWRRMLRVRTRRPRPLRSRPGCFRRGPPDVRPTLSRCAEDTGARGPDGSRYQLFRTNDGASAQAATSRVHRFDGLAAERRRDAVLRAVRFSRASGRSSPTPHSASSDARRRLP